MPFKPITSNETDYIDYITFKLKNNQQYQIPTITLLLSNLKKIHVRN